MDLQILCYRILNDRIQAIVNGNFHTLTMSVIFQQGTFSCSKPTEPVCGLKTKTGFYDMTV